MIERRQSLAQIIPLKTKDYSKSFDKLEQIVSPIKGEINLVDEIIKQGIESPMPLIPKLASHLLFNGGKRIRPSLTIFSTKLFNHQESRHLKLAACIEFIHSATLLHDDVVDAGLLRRGKKTTNIIWGNKASILVGDFLLSRAFNLMIADSSMEILKTLSNTASIIAEGQILELTASRDIEMSEATYLDVIKSKTAQLFSSACEVGAIISNQSNKERAALKNFGLNLGNAFQIIDDILDYISDEKKFGKTIGGDFQSGKMSLPVILAYNRGNEKERSFWYKTIKEKKQTPRDFKKAIRIMNLSNAIQDSIKRAKFFASIAVDSLKIFPDSFEKQALLKIVNFSVNRSY